jgi:pimeloyl-ACP methyl ester carboxylesterase
MPRTLTFLPGTMCDQRLWAPVRTRLDTHFSTAYLPIESQATREGMLALLVLAADPAPLHLVAFSMGGYLALDFALEHPDRVASLVAVGSSAFGLTETEKAERGRALELLARHDYRGMATSRLQQFVHPSRWTRPEVVGVIRAMERDLGKEMLVAQLKETSARHSLCPQLWQLQIDILLIGADTDRFVPWSDIEEMTRLIPHAQSVLAKDAGHMLPLEQPDWLAAQIIRFHGGATD